MTIQVRSNEKPQAPTPPPPPPAAEVESAPKAAEAGEVKEHETLSDTNAAPEEAKPSSEQKDASDSETEGKSTEPKAEDKDHEEVKKKGGFQRRIDKLNAQKAQMQQEMDYWKQMALKSAGTASQSAPAQSAPAPKVELPSSDAKPDPDQYETHQAYVEALTDWKTEQKLRERDQKAARERMDQEQTKLVSSYQERMKSFSEKTPDFHEVIAEVDHIPLSPTLRDMILKSENGPELAYELARVPGEYERIARLDPLACARELGKFESRVFRSSKGSAEETKKLTQAPKPLQPVGTGGKGSVPKSIFDSSLSQAEYEAMRREQIKKRRQTF